MNITLPAPELPAQFYEERKSIIGGSDIAALAGLKSFGSKHSIYARLTGIDIPFEPTDRTIAGQYLESTIARMFVDAMAFRYGETIKAVTQNPLGNPLFFVRPDMKWWGSHPDAVLFRDTDPFPEYPYAIAQFKNVAADQAYQWGESGTDQAPEGYLLQVHHEMGSITACKIEIGYLVVLIGGNDLRIYPVERNENILKNIANIGEAFMACHVIPRIPPPIDETEDCTALLTALRPPDKGLEIKGTLELSALAVELKAAVVAYNEAKANQDLLKNKIIAAMNAAGGASAVIGQGYKFTYRQNKPGKKIDYDGIMNELAVSQDIIDRHTTTTEGAFVFRKTFDK